MSIALNFGNYNNYHISESYLSNMVHSDRKSATKMHWWDIIKDFFRTEKQSQALDELYNVVHGNEGKDKLDAFNILSNLAKPEYQHQFTKRLDGDEMHFYIGEQPISNCRIQTLMNLDPSTSLLPMNPEEKTLFIRMLDTLREIELSDRDLSSSNIRREMSYRFCDEVSQYYRPNENIYGLGVEWNPATEIKPQDQTLLECINSGSFSILGQFSRIGYQKTDDGVMFTMMHPAMTYLLGTYNRVDAMGAIAIDNADLVMANSHFMQVFNQDFNDYQSNKEAIDAILRDVYLRHGGTLDISLSAQNRNKLVVPELLFIGSLISTRF